VHTASAEADKVEYRLDALLTPEAPATAESRAGEPRTSAAQKNPSQVSKNTADANSKGAKESTVS
jgi:hypothetical protein